MGIEEVGVCATSSTVVGIPALLGCDGCEQLTVYLMGFLPFLQSCPEVDAPACAPTRRLVAFDLQGALCSLLQGGISEMTARVEADEMALVTVLEVSVVPVVVPFVQVSHVSDGIGVQVGERFLDVLVSLA